MLLLSLNNQRILLFIFILFFSKGLHAEPYEYAFKHHRTFSHAIGLILSNDVGLSYKYCYNDYASFYLGASSFSFENKYESLRIQCLYQRNVLIGRWESDNRLYGCYWVYGMGFAYDEYFKDFTTSNNFAPFSDQGLSYTKGKTTSFAANFGFETPFSIAPYRFLRKAKHFSIGIDCSPQIGVLGKNSGKLVINSSVHLRYVFGLHSLLESK